MRPAFVALLIFAAACRAAPAEQKYTFRATVERVADGDSFHVRDERGRKLEIRLVGIDAPERSQPYANQSRKALSDLMKGKVVEVQVVEPDRYGRLVSRVTQGGTDVALAQLKSGMAWVYPRAQTIPKGYHDAQKKAHETGAGLWRDRRPIPPWEFRQRP